MLYELVWGKCGVQCGAPPITIGALAASGFHPLVVYTIGAIQNQHARESNPPTKEGKPPRNEKDEDEGEVGVESE